MTTDAGGWERQRATGTSVPAVFIKFRRGKVLFARLIIGLGVTQRRKIPAIAIPVILYYTV